MYYLQSRYYNPEWGRFINADALVSTGQGLLGNNMFAYCLNNPVLLYDPYGAVARISKDMSLANDSMWGRRGYIPGGVREPVFDLWGSICDVADFLGNTSEAVVLQSNGISFYRGAMVIRADIGPNGGAASYGIIILDDYYKNDQYGVDTLHHEYGHFRHMKQIGIIAYTATTAIPSLIGAAISDPKGTGIQIFLSQNYYSQPWERIADQLGGVNHGYLPVADTLGSLYWLYTCYIGRLLS